MTVSIDRGRKGAMLRRAKPETSSEAATRFAERLIYEADLQHNAYVPGVGALTGRLTGSPGRSVVKRLSLLVDRHVYFSLQRICRDFSVFLDYPDDAALDAPPTAIIMQRLGVSAAIPLTWSRNRLVVGEAMVSLNAATAGEDLTGAICRRVARYFVGG